MPRVRRVTPFASLVLLAASVAAGPARATTRYAFTCSCLGERSVGRAGCGPRGPKSMAVTVTTQTVTTRAPGYNGTYRYDARYRSQTYLRFNGPSTSVASYALLVEKPLLRGGYALRTGGKGGYVSYTVRGEAFESTRYICRR